MKKAIAFLLSCSVVLTFCSVGMTVGASGEGAAQKTIENFDSYSSTQELMQKVTIFNSEEWNVHSNIGVSLDTTYKNSGSNSMKLSIGVTPDNASGMIFLDLLDSQSNPRDMTGTNGIRIWVKNSGGTSTSPNYLKFKPQILSVGVSQAARPVVNRKYYLMNNAGTMQPYYFTNDDGDGSCGVMVPDDFEGFVFIPFSSMALFGGDGQPDWTKVYQMKIYLNNTYAEKNLYMDSIEAYNMPVLIQDFDSFSTTQELGAVSAVYAPASNVTLTLDSTNSDSAPNSIKIVAGEPTSDTNYMGLVLLNLADASGNAQDLTGQSGLRFWAKTNGTANTSVGYFTIKPQFMSVGAPNRTRPDSNAPYYLVDQDGKTTAMYFIDEDGDGSSGFRIPDNFEGYVYIPLSSMTMFGGGAPDWSQLTFAYLYMNDKIYKNKEVYIDSIQSYDSSVDLEGNALSGTVMTVISSVGDITLGKQSAVAAAQDSYDALTTEQQTKVTNYSVLQEGEDELSALLSDDTAATNTGLLISAIGSVTLDSEAAIMAARTSYDALTTSQKQMVTNYNTLVSAEGEYLQIKKTIENFDSYSSTQELLQKVTVFNSDEYQVHSNITATLDETYKNSGANSMKLSVGVTPDNSCGLVFLDLMDSQSKPKDMSGFDGVRIWVKNYGGSSLTPSYIKFKPQFLSVGASQAARPVANSQYYLTDYSGKVQNMTFTDDDLDGSCGVMVPDNFEGFVYIPFDSMALFGGDGQPDWTRVYLMKMLFHNSYAQKTIYVDTIQCYENSRTFSVKKNTFADFDTLTAATLGTVVNWNSQTGPFTGTQSGYGLNPNESGKDVGSKNSLAFCPNYTPGNTITELVIDSSNNMIDRTGEEGIQFWCKASAGWMAWDVNHTYHPDHIDIGVQFNAPSKIKLIPGAPIYLTNMNGTKQISFAMSDSTIRIYEGWSGTVKIPFTSMQLSGSGKFDLTGFNRMYLSMNNQYFNLMVFEIDSITTYNSSIKVSDMLLNKSGVTLVENNTEALTSTILSEDASNKNVLWVSGDESIAEVSQMGVISAKKLGSVTITATTVDGNISKTCIVTVVPPVEFTSHKVTGGYITDVAPGATVNSFLDGISINGTTTVSFLARDGVTPIINGYDSVGTDTTVRVISGDKTTDYKIIIYGDVTGDGNIFVTDLVAMKNHFIGIKRLTGNEIKAGRIYSSDGDINIVDLLAIKDFVLNGTSISQNK